MVTAHFPVGIELERRAGASGPEWQVAAIRPAARAIPDGAVLAEANGATRFYAGTARLTIRASEAGLCAAALASEPPVLHVVLHPAATPPGWGIGAVSLLEPPSESSGEALRAALPIPPGLRGWIADFVARHHRPDAPAAPPPEPREAPDRPDGFLDRWSRLKQRERQPAPPRATGPMPAAPAPAAPAPSPPAASPDLPPLDSLRTRGDYAAYLRQGVPPALRLAALRQAWARDPAIAGHRPLVDYDWNFNAPGYGQLRPTDDAGALIRSLFGHLQKAMEDDAAPPPESPTAAEAEPPRTTSETTPEPPGEPDPPPPAPRRHGGASPA